MKNKWGRRIGVFALAAISSALMFSTNAMTKYLKDTQKSNLDHINKLVIYNVTKYMSLDINARRNLEITANLRDKSKKGTLLWVLDKTATAMGGRMLRRWLSDPLVDEVQINKRLNSVEELKNNTSGICDISSKYCNKIIKDAKFRKKFYKLYKIIKRR